MRWQGRRESSNVEDRRGTVPRKLVGGGLGTLVIILLVWILGGNPLQFLNNMQVDTQTSESTYQSSPEENELKHFVSVVLAETEDVWGAILKKQNMTYEQPKLVIYNNQVESACGLSGSATGPFYCPGDKKLYLDLSFFDELKKRFDAPGDFAIAYVVAHEVGHHIQNLLGTSDKVMALRSRLSEAQFNKYLVRLELQADFLAGVWANHAERMHKILEEGDIDEALNAASAVGDDRIQKSSQGYIVPDAFTHGTSEQRRKWFYKGYTTGEINEGDTFTEINL
jgi:uncharacterized protein